MVVQLLVCFCFFNDTATTEIYTLSLHDALPIHAPSGSSERNGRVGAPRRPFLLPRSGFVSLPSMTPNGGIAGRTSVKLTSCALLAVLAMCSTASAQLAPQRTWPELKEAVQERANRNAYPMTGIKADDVREILSQINSLDRDEWAAAWSRMGERYQTRAAEQEKTDPKAASESYLVAFRYFAFGGWPTPNSAGKKAAFDSSVAAFRKHAQLSDPP